MSVVLDGVTKAFGGAPVVDRVSLALEPGTFCVVLGPSGCGKSTLLRLIAGLETLDAGAIALGGRRVAGPGLHLAPEARGVGVVFQSYALWPHMSVAANVAFPIEAAGARREAALAEAATHLRAVALEQLADRLPAALSGGQRQRVALARCLASRAGAVLMDEPLANLDPHLRAAMEEELSAFHARAGATTLYITHDQREAMALGDVVAVMRAGRFEQVAPPQQVYARPATDHVARFIGRAALLPARLTRAGAGSARAEIGGGGAAVSMTVACTETATDGPATVVIRPEDVALGHGALTARIVSARYRGGVWEGSATVEGLAEPLPVTSRDRLAPGDTTPLAITRGWAIPT